MADAANGETQVVEQQETAETEQSTDQEQPATTEQPTDGSQQEQPAGEQPEDESGEEELSTDIPAEVLRKKLTEANAEAAKYRSKLREVEALLSERKSPEEVEALVGELRTERETAERQLMVEVVALQHNVPQEMRETLGALASTGMSREDLEKHAKAFGQAVTKEVPNEPQGGLNPTTHPEEADDPRARVRRLRRTRI